MRQHRWRRLQCNQSVAVIMAITPSMVVPICHIKLPRALQRTVQCSSFTGSKSLALPKSWHPSMQTTMTMKDETSNNGNSHVDHGAEESALSDMKEFGAKFYHCRIASETVPKPAPPLPNDASLKYRQFPR